MRLFFFFFKQKTAYEITTGDWSSDVCSSDLREAIETALSCIGLTPPERARVIRIKNTLMLGEIEVSEAFSPDLAKRPDLTPLGEPVPLTFDAAGRLASR